MTTRTAAEIEAEASQVAVLCVRMERAGKQASELRARWWALMDEAKAMEESDAEDTVLPTPA